MKGQEMAKTAIQQPPRFSRYVYEVRVGGGGGDVKATFCCEADANGYARQIGGMVYAIGAIR